jgi:hypothetical protein
VGAGPLYSADDEFWALRTSHERNELCWVAVKGFQIGKGSILAGLLRLTDRPVPTTLVALYRAASDSPAIYKWRMQAECCCWNSNASELLWTLLFISVYIKRKSTLFTSIVSVNYTSVVVRRRRPTALKPIQRMLEKNLAERRAYSQVYR